MGSVNATGSSLSSYSSSSSSSSGASSSSLSTMFVSFSIIGEIANKPARYTFLLRKDAVEASLVMKMKTLEAQGKREEFDQCKEELYLRVHRKVFMNKESILWAGGNDDGECIVILK